MIPSPRLEQAPGFTLKEYAILKSDVARRMARILGVISLLAVLGAELALSARQQSQTFDEAAHIFAGYRYWKNGDFGINPEHPPVVKLVAAAPLLRLPLKIPPLKSGYFKGVEFLSGAQFLYANDADGVLFRARLAASVFTLCLALVVFLATSSMWGTAPAFIALILLVFEPNILAHGALVTTDMGVTFGIFLAVYAFYLYVKKPSRLMLVGTGAIVGLGIAAKHSGIMIFPMLFLLALTELMPWWGNTSSGESDNTKKHALRLAASIAIISGIALVVLWSTYDFRFESRPEGLHMDPPLSEFLSQVTPFKARIIQQIANWRLLPESYLFGLADVAKVSEATPTFLLGKVYPQGQWFYFPAVFAIKSTLGFLLLCLLAPMAKALRRKEIRREVLFLTIPPALYLVVAMNSGINLGVRHILPVYPFLAVLAAIAAWNLARRHSAWGVLVTALLIFHVVSSVRTFPNYLAYSNELWGGSANTYKVLADSNVDWGQGLKAMKRYMDQHQITDCSFAYFASLVVDPSYYGIRCKPLPTSLAMASQVPMEVIPQNIEGPVFLSASEISGTFWGGDAVNPYLQFVERRPTSSIADSILVFDGRFDMSLAAALTHESLATQFVAREQFDEALAEADQAIAIAPHTFMAHAARGNVLAKMKRDTEAQEEFQKAQALAMAANSGR